MAKSRPGVRPASEETEGGHVILRLLRASFRPENAPAIIAALRAEANQVRSWPGLLAWTHGVRREGSLIHGLTLSGWSDLDALMRVAGGRPDRDMSEVWRTGALRGVSAAHYELTEPADGADLTFSGDVLGVVWGTIRPNVEGAVHDMVRAIRPTVAAAGVGTLYIGRRVNEQRTEIVVVAPWRDRLSLHEWARTRPVGAIDPAFTSQLDDFRFETYDSIAPERFSGLPSGPAVLTVDDAGLCIDATPGVEAVLGTPGEMLLHHPLRALVGDGADELLAALTSRTPTDLVLTIRPWPGRSVAIRATVEPDNPRAGLHALSLEAAPDREGDLVPVVAGT
jgi:hypothetical protein